VDVPEWLNSAIMSINFVSGNFRQRSQLICRCLHWQPFAMAGSRRSACSGVRRQAQWQCITIGWELWISKSGFED